MRVIRLTNMSFLLLILFISVFQAFPAASQTDINRKVPPKALLNPISVNLNDIPLRDALAIIAEKGNFNLNYNETIVPVEQKVSLNVTNVPAFEALIKVLDGTGTELTITSSGALVIIPSSGEKGTLKGMVIDKKTKEPIAGVNITVAGTRMGAFTAKDGRFHITQLPKGIYSVDASMIGYTKQRLNNIIITGNASLEVNFELAIEPIPLNNIIVTPGHFSLMKSEPTSRNALKSDDLRDFPQLGEDIFRAVKRLPGLAGNDYSAKFAVRGGEHDEVLVMLDGMELHDPFHLKDIGGGLSIVDVELINNIDMMTGAFPAEYGNKLSGVFNMKTRTPVDDKPRTSLAVSFLNTRFLSEGTFNQGKGSWQLLARRGYIDYILDLTGDDNNTKPVFYDFYNKVQYFLNNDHLISAHLLASQDRLKILENDDEDQFETKDGNTYGWLKWEAQYTPAISARTVLSKGRITHDKFAVEYDYGPRYFEVTDERYFDIYGIRQDWSYTLSNRMIMQWGGDFKKLYAEYDYHSRKHKWWLPDNPTDSVKYAFDKNGNQLGLYMKSRFRFYEPLTTEIGLRYDRVSWSGDENYSPRVNAAYNFGKRTTFRAGWGKFYQAHGIYQLSIIDAERKYSSANASEHFIVGIEHAFRNNVNLRIESYLKKLSEIRPRYYNYNDEFDMTPETSRDRITIDPEKGESKGIEFYIHKDNMGKHSIWMSYGYSIVEEVINGQNIPRNMDQRHTINIDYNYRPSKKWSLNMSWHYHSGWPYTDQKLVSIENVENQYLTHWDNGPINGNRLPAYHRMDIRLNRNYYTSKGLISIFFEARNLYNRNNVRRYQNNLFINSETDYNLITITEGWLPLIPSFGVRWDF